MRPGVWVTGALIALLAVGGFVALGFWQLARFDERRALNSEIAAKTDTAPIELATLVASHGSDVDELAHRRVRVSGQYEIDHEIIVQARSLQGRSGHLVVTPLRTGAGLIAVNRGWVPIDSDGPPVPTAIPPSGTVTVVGTLHTSEHRGPTGSIDADGFYSRIGRLDLALLEPQWGRALLPVYLQLEEQAPPSGRYPVPLPPPETDPGPHLSYAIQWFVFAGIVAVGFPILVITTMRRRSSKRSGRPPDAGAGR